MKIEASQKCYFCYINMFHNEKISIDSISSDDSFRLFATQYRQCDSHWPKPLIFW